MNTGHRNRFLLEKGSPTELRWKNQEAGIVILTLILLMGGAVAESPPPSSQQPASSSHILTFSPTGTVKQVRQVRVLFSDPMVPFGDPRSRPSPFTVECPVAGGGRWVDPENWVYDFEKTLPSGLACRFRLQEEVRTLEGQRLGGPTEFEFSTGGPDIVFSDPPEGSRSVNEDQVFLLELDGEVDEASVLERAHFVVPGHLEQIGVRILEGAEREEILRHHWRYRDGVSAPVLLLQARLTLPAESEVHLVWDEGIRTRTGVSRDQPHILPFVTRGEFVATFHCQRENPVRDCIPLTSMRLNFSAAVSRELASQVRLEEEDGSVRSAVIPGNSEWVNGCRFEGPFPERSRFVLHVPEGIRDDAGRPLSNARRFPLVVRTDEYPPLAKFASDFGILEWKANPVLPLTVRNLEPELEFRLLPLEAPPPLRDLQGSLRAAVLRILPGRIDQILAWMSKIERRSWEDRGTSVFHYPALFLPQRFSIPKPHGGKAFEVVGIPLTDPGFYVVEVESELLGASLLGNSQPMYVPTTVLVTNLAVHFKWGLDSSLAWVTSLDEGRPVSGASVEVRNCLGEVAGSGTSDRQGVVRFENLPSREEVPVCSYTRFGQGLVVTARHGEDMAFVHSSWQEGIEPWRFQLPQESDSRLVVAHTIFDRTLLRAGEVLHMKHLLRRHTTAGFALVPEQERPDTLLVEHWGSGQRYEFPLQWDSLGSAESLWEIPPEARLGFYDTRLVRKDSKTSWGFQREWRSGTFRVEEFRVPLLSGVLRPPAGDLIRPAEIPVDLTARYLSGGPAVRLPVTFRYQVRMASGPSFEAFPDFLFANGKVSPGVLRRGEEPDRGREFPVHSRDLTLDASGSARVAIRDLPELDLPQRVQAELEFRDPNGEIQTVSGQIPLWPSARLVGVQVESWIGARSPLKARFAVTDLSGRPMAGAEVTTELFRKEVFSHRRRLVGGFYGYEHVTEIQRVGPLCQGQTDEMGILECQLDSPPSGNLILEASVADSEGRVSSAHREIWVVGNEPWWFSVEDHDRIDVVPEQERYEPGETARFQVRMPFQEATALVTVEREGVGEVFVRRLSGREPVVEIPVRGHYAPNVYVSVLVVRGRAGGVQPTALVDLGKPAYKLGIGQIQVGRKAHELTVQVKTDREVYPVRGVAQVSISVETADGRPLPRGSEVAVAAVDEGLLELMPNESWRVVEAMIGRRACGVETSTAQMHVVGKRHFGLKALPHGGGGGRKLTRELFDTLLFWKGRVPPGPARAGPAGDSPQRLPDSLPDRGRGHRGSGPLRLGRKLHPLQPGPDALFRPSAGGAPRGPLSGRVHRTQRLGRAPAGPPAGRHGACCGRTRGGAGSGTGGLAGGGVGSPRPSRCGKSHLPRHG